MNEELPEVYMSVCTVVLDRMTGQVEVNYEGMNYLEAIGILVVARNQVEETAFGIEVSFEPEGDWDEE